MGTHGNGSTPPRGGSGEANGELVTSEASDPSFTKSPTIPAPENENEDVEAEVVPGEESDFLSSWKKTEPWKPATLEQIHLGLISTYEYTKAAVENNVKMASDVRDIVGTLDMHTHHIEGLAAKVESVLAFSHQLDEDLVKEHLVLNTVRLCVQSMKEDVERMKEHVNQIPAIKDLLVDILTRLPAAPRE